MTTFPPGFPWGAATSAYQLEGGPAQPRGLDQYEHGYARIAATGELPAGPPAVTPFG